MNSRAKKTIWWVAGAILVSALLMGWLQWRRGEDGQRAVGDLLAEMRAEGFKTELSEFSVTTDPATRARMAMLTFLHNPIGYGPHQESMDYLPVETNDAAMVVWKRAKLAADSEPVQWADLHAALDTNDGALDQACAIAMSGPIQFDVDLSLSSSWMDHLTALSHLSRALGSRVILQLHDNQPDAAWTNLVTMTRLATAWAPEPTPMYYLMRSQAARLAFQCTWQALQTDKWPDAQLAVLQQEWEGADFLTNLSETVACGRSKLFSDCELEAGLEPFGDLSWSHLIHRGAGDDPYDWRDLVDDFRLIRFRSTGVYEDELRILNNSRERATEIARASPFTTWAELRRLPIMTNRVLSRMMYRPLSRFAESMEAGDNAAVFAAADAEARRRVTVVAIAIERYRGKHGEYPKRLDLLAPEFLHPVPVDFIDGKPLRYRFTGDGHFVLYSIGLDGVDDGGKMLPPGAKILPTDKDGFCVAPTNVDVVWPRPAAE